MRSRGKLCEHSLTRRIPARSDCDARAEEPCFRRSCRIVQGYIRQRVEFNGLHPCEIGLQTYAQRIIGLLIAAITPDDAKGEAPSFAET